jgi:5-oxoprolinase (ATP-hydrolysing)
VPGPAVLIDAISTIVVEPGWTAVLTADGNVRIDRASGADGGADGADGAAADGAAANGADGGAEDEVAIECDPIQLAIFSHRWGGGAGRGPTGLVCPQGGAARIKLCNAGFMGGAA